MELELDFLQHARDKSWEDRKREDGPTEECVKVWRQGGNMRVPSVLYPEEHRLLEQQCRLALTTGHVEETENQVEKGLREMHMFGDNTGHAQTTAEEANIALLDLRNAHLRKRFTGPSIRTL